MASRTRTLVVASGIALVIGALVIGVSHRQGTTAKPEHVSPLPLPRPLPSAGVRERARERERAEAPTILPSAKTKSARLARAEQTLQAYLDATRYPPDARPISERPDLVRPHQAPIRTLPLARADRAITAARVTLRQDRYFAAGDERITLGITCSGESGPTACEVISSRAVLPPDMPGNIDPVAVPFGDDGQGGVTATFQPSRQGFSTYHGPVRIEVDLRVGQESGAASFDVQYTPAPPAEFTGAVREAMVSGSLELHVGIKVDKPGRYVLRARVDDADGKSFAFLTDNEVLAQGAREARLRLFGKLVHDAGARSPFRLRDLEGFLLEENATPDRANMVDREGTVYTTKRYADGEFSAAEWDSDEKANHLRELTRDVERAGDPEKG